MRYVDGGFLLKFMYTLFPNQNTSTNDKGFAQVFILN